MFASWPSLDVSSLDINIYADLISVNGGHEVNCIFQGMGSSKDFYFIWDQEGLLSRCQAGIWKHDFKQELLFPRNVTQNLLMQEISWIYSLSWIGSSEVEPVNQQVFNKNSCKSGLLINQFVLDAGRRSEKGEDTRHLAPLKTSHHNEEEGNTFWE